MIESSGNRQKTRSARREFQPRRIRPAEWMKATGMSTGATYRALYSGELRAVQVGRAWFIEASELEDFFERQRAA
jgi:hypothetical protein